MSTVQFLSYGRPLYDASHPAGPQTSVCPAARRTEKALLAVELDDHLLLHLGVDHLARGQRVHEHPHPVRVDLEPRRHGALAGLGPGDDERRHLVGLLPHRDDVVLADPGAGDVQLLAVDQDVAVPDQLAGHVAGLGEAGAVHDVVDPALQDAQQVLAGLARAAVRLLVVAPELLLQDAVDARSLLLLAHLQEVLALLDPGAAVLTRRVGADLDRALGAVALGALEVELDLLAAATLAVWAGVPSHVFSDLLEKRGLCRFRRGDAWAGGNRCAAPGSRQR